MNPRDTAATTALDSSTPEPADTTAASDTTTAEPGTDNDTSSVTTSPKDLPWTAQLAPHHFPRPGVGGAALTAQATATARPTRAAKPTPTPKPAPAPASLPTRTVTGEAVVMFPQTDYGAHLIDHLWRNYGVSSISVSRTWRDRLVLEHRFPVLQSPAVSASYVLGHRDIAELADALRQRHHVAAVIPHHEESVLPMSELAAELDLSWAQPSVLPLFRDKAALKATVRANDPALRITRSGRVDSAEYVLDLARRWGIDRFVLKPNDGGGNSRVGFFNSYSSAEQVAAHLRRIGGAAVMEEYVDGEEFYVNGQVDHLGNSLIVAVHQYRQVDIHGKANVSVRADSVPRSDPRFEVLADYARRVVGATGLKRSPFHLEAKIDGEGPSLIEVAARLVGMGAASLDSLLSGIDVFDLATHYYLHDHPYPRTPAPPKELFTASVLGVSENDGRICDVTGVEQVEGLPGFHGWVRRPVEGLQVRSTVDLDSTPWAAQMVAEEAETIHRSATAARQTLRWNTEGPGGWQRINSVMSRAWRARPRLWLLNTNPIAPRSRWRR